jgi:purine-cytosine permease-like protein
VHRAVTLGGALVLLGVMVGAAVSNPDIPLSDLAVAGGMGAACIVALALGRWPDE